MPKKIIIGIDVGKHGALCIMEENTSPILYPMPMVKSELDYNELYNIVDSYYSEGHTIPIHIIFEKLGVIFGTSKSTAFSMGHQAGAVEMLCISLGVPFTKISPKLWQKEMFQGTNLVTKKSKSGKSTVTDTKATALIVAKQLFPDVKLTFGDRATKPHDGLIDALLISQYAIRKNL